MLRVFYYPNEPDGPNVKIKYPRRARAQVDVIRVTDREHAQRLWNVRTRKYIFDTLRGWTLQRQYTFRYAENNFKNVVRQNDDAVEAILHMLMSHYESALPVLASKVAQLSAEIDQIAPKRWSRFLSYYREVIQPIVQWCEEYSNEFYSKKANNH